MLILHVQFEPAGTLIIKVTQRPQLMKASSWQVLSSTISITVEIDSFQLYVLALKDLCILLRHGHKKIPLTFQWPRQVTFYWRNATPNLNRMRRVKFPSSQKEKSLTKSKKVWHTVTGRLYHCFKIFTPSALSGQSALFCTSDSGLGCVTYFREWNVAEETMCQFWVETSQVQVLPTVLHSCTFSWEEYSPGSHCFFSMDPEMRVTWSWVEPMPNQPIFEPQILEWNRMFVVQCWDLRAFC